MRNAHPLPASNSRPLPVTHYPLRSRPSVVSHQSSRILSSLQLLVQREPLGFELAQLARDVGLVEDQGLERILPVLAVDPRLGELGFDRHLLPVELRQLLVEALQPRFQRLARR